MTPADFSDAMRAVVNHKSEAVVRALGEALIGTQLGRGMPAYIEPIMLWAQRLEQLAAKNDRPRPRRVVVETPTGGNAYSMSALNHRASCILYAREAMNDSLMRGEAPISSYLLMTQAPHDGEALRDAYRAAGDAWFAAADFVAFYCDRGISPNMERAAEEAERVGTPVVWRRTGELDTPDSRVRIGARP